ncbi:MULTISPECIES: helix-turn-helix domain-containing protein [unclassified Streptomyces]|uniref:helix-turn-helix domain-containing protein n=1 Tax=unclassified Streptomyces TaxID=2593676 RepID=UPI00099836D2|nr:MULTISPECIES: helix-turn-helix domain-containing protein [unclassified Streptomyces]MYQ80293.1 hypothetical protein [Streptomyces sp. SID4923]
MRSKDRTPAADTRSSGAARRTRTLQRAHRPRDRLHLDTVRRWRGRFADRGLGGLSDRDRSGRPPSYTALQVAEAKARACRLPAETGVPLARWSCPDLARELAARDITGPVSASTVRR